MSGSINLVSKSAFERSTAEFKYRAGLSSNQQRFALKRTPAPSNDLTYKVYPDLSFDYTLPVTKRLGLVITGLHSITSFETDSGVTNYRASGTGINASSANPYLWQWSNIEVFRSYERDSLSARVDWRPSAHAVLSMGAMATYYDALNWNSQFNPTAGTIGTPTVAGGTAMSFTPEQVVARPAGAACRSRSVFPTSRASRNRAASATGSIMARGTSSPTSAVPNRSPPAAMSTPGFSARSESACAIPCA
jgi:hypothetical protein